MEEKIKSLKKDICGWSRGVRAFPLFGDQQVLQMKIEQLLLSLWYSLSSCQTEPMKE